MNQQEIKPAYLFYNQDAYDESKYDIQSMIGYFEKRTKKKEGRKLFRKYLSLFIILLLIILLIIMFMYYDNRNFRNLLIIPFVLTSLIAGFVLICLIVNIQLSRLFQYLASMLTLILIIILCFMILYTKKINGWYLGGNVTSIFLSMILLFVIMIF